MHKDAKTTQKIKYPQTRYPHIKSLFVLSPSCALPLTRCRSCIIARVLSLSLFSTPSLALSPPSFSNASKERDSRSLSHPPSLTKPFSSPQRIHRMVTECSFLNPSRLYFSFVFLFKCLTSSMCPNSNSLPSSAGARKNHSSGCAMVRALAVAAAPKPAELNT